MIRGKRRRIALLVAAQVILIFGVLTATWNQSATPTACRQTQLDAYARMERCIQAIQGYRSEMGIPFSPLDYRKTGLIGEEYSDITTTLGMIEAKRTAADPDMAALLVRMFWEAGLRPGDRVGAGFSGSFPSLNLAVLCAGDAMGLEITYISSIGASSYGANHPDFTFVDIAHRLYSDGLISSDSALVTPGGDYDNGKGVFNEEAFDPILARAAGWGIEILRQEDYQKNLAARRSVYDRNGIDCFVSVGGNISSIGLGDDVLSLGQGVLHHDVSPDRLDNKSGLIEWYLAQGLPVIHLLNIRKIVADYAMPFDPLTQAAPGDSAVYWQASYPKSLIALTLLITACLILAVRMVRKTK